MMNATTHLPSNNSVPDYVPPGGVVDFDLYNLEGTDKDLTSPGDGCE
jgi:hypothetical protein